MRITRRGLRKIIAEEHARILAEMKMPKRDEDKTDADWAEEQDQGVMDMYGHLDPYGDAEAEEMGYEYDGAGGYIKPGQSDDDLYETEKKGRVSPRKALGRYLASHDADDESIFRAIDRAISRSEASGEMPTSEDITFNLSDEVLDAIPEDDADKWHSMLEDVLADEFDAGAYADAEADRRGVEDTERDLSHPSRFLEEGGDMGEYEHAYSMGGGSDEEGFAIDYDTGRPSPFAAKMFGQPAAGADDIEGADADEDVFGDDDMGHAGAMDDYHHALKLGGGRDEEGFAADYDTGKRSRFPSARGGINEARWAKLAGILKD